MPAGDQCAGRSVRCPDLVTIRRLPHPTRLHHDGKFLGIDFFSSGGGAGG